jgi:hypothetical protein
MICQNCEGKGIVPTDQVYQAQPWDGDNRRNNGREMANADLKFSEVKAALYRSCEVCDGSGKLHQNLLFTQK